MQFVERGFRSAALHMGNRACMAFLSALSEAPPLCPACGQPMSFLERRSKTLTTLMGTDSFSRSYYLCEACGQHHMPKDHLLGVHHTAFSPGVRRAVTILSSAGSFEWTSDVLADVADISVSAKECQRIAEQTGEKLICEFEARKNELWSSVISAQSNLNDSVCPPEKTIPAFYIEADGTGIPMMKRETAGRTGKQEDGSAKTREAKLGCIFTQTKADEKGDPVRDPKSTSYFGAIETAELFGERVYVQAIERGMQRANRVVFLADGAKWLWNIADLHFPQAIQIVDLYHASEHIHTLIRKLCSIPDQIAELTDDWIGALKQGDIEVLTAKIEAYPAPDHLQDEVKREINYLLENKERMRYAKFKSQCLFVGSGVIEAGCKTVIGKRLKNSGMFWSLRGANSMIAVRCADLSCNMDIMGAA
ncbi:MAG: ISKra4 family transposase [Gracilibacteraceae bacterium]|nr:ISKra4 family transposase [Gracilibacteraceae bacterium]